MEDVIKHAGSTPNFFQLYLPGDRELAASFLDRAESSGYSSVVVTVDSWTLGYRPADLAMGNYPQVRAASACRTTTPTKTSPNTSRSHPTKIRPRRCSYYGTIFAVPLSWEDLRWIRSQTNLPIAVKGIQHPDDARMAIDNGADVLYGTNHGGRQANSGIPTLRAAARCRGGGRLHSGHVRFRRTSATDAVIALALGATAVGIGRSYAYALSYGGAESLTHYLNSFLAELDLCLAICGFKDIASLKEAGCELAIDLQK